ncbi:MAG: TIGR02099 family protein [Xanthomonadales bacterium]|nr:TIGR02099 family protein [Xanthomonadales bacterium]
MRRTIRFARHALLRGTAVLLLLAAALVGILRLAAPWLADQPELLATVLSEALRADVRLQSAESRWDGSGPRLALQGLELGERDSAERLQVQQSELQLDLFGFLPSRHWVREIIIDGVALTVEGRDGQWGVSGLPQPRGGDPDALQRWLGRLGAVRLRQVVVTLIDHDRDWRLQTPPGDLLLAREGEALRLGLRVGDVDADAGSLQLVLRPSADLRGGQGWLGLDTLALKGWGDRIQAHWPLPQHGHLDGGVWWRWADGRMVDGHIDMHLVDVGIGAAESIELPEVGEVEPRSGLPDGRLLASWWLDAGVQRFSADWEDDEGRLPWLDGQWTLDEGDLGVNLQGVSLRPLAGIAPLLPLSEQARAALYQANPHGQIDHLQLRRPAGGEWWLEASLSGLEVSAHPQRWPAVSDLQLYLMADAQGAWGELRGDPPSVAWPGAWPERVQLEALEAQFALGNDESGRELWFHSADIRYGGSVAQGRGNLRIEPGKPPVLQLEAHASGALAPSRLFWTRNKMSPKSVAWLEEALDNGHLDEARFFYRGAPRDWPFAKAQGRMELLARGSGVDLDFHQDWPSAQLRSAQARIINRSLWIDAVDGVISGVPAQATGSIGSFRDPVLALSVQGGGQSADMLALLRHSPLEQRYGSVLLGMAVNGNIDTQLDLTIPLKNELGEPVLDGTAEVKGVNFSDAKWNTRLFDIHGQARYSLSGFAAPALQARFGDSDPVGLALALGSEHTGSADLAFEARLDGSLTATDLFADHAEDLAAILLQTHGRSRWQGRLQIPREGDASLSLSSDLQGTRIGFPAPLAKSAAAAAPLQLQLSLTETPRLALELGGALPLRLQARLPHLDQPFEGHLDLGSPETTEACPNGDCLQPGLRIAGRADRVELGGWLAWLAAQSMEEGPPLQLAGVDLTLSEIDLLGSASPAKRLGYEDLGEGGWKVTLDSDAVAGSVRLDPRDGKPALAAQFSRLHLPDASDAAGQGGTLDPRQLPALHFAADELKVGPALLGQTRIEAYPTADGLRFEQLDARSPGLTLAGSGLWGVDPRGGIASSFQLRFSAEDLGQMLLGLGFEAPVRGGQTLASIDARWEGPPTAFGLERLAGTMDVSVGPGQLLDLDPGAGRVFGLFALRALPRRLTLDFRDVFGTGLAFDSIQGSFQFQEGNAWTTDLNVRGPAADISIVGRTGLALRDYDQEVAVLPRVGSAFPVVGALAGGPAGAAAGWLMQGMLGGGLDGANRYLYSVTGTWEDPAVERLDRPLVRRDGEG